MGQIKVDIVGDASSLERAMKKADAAAGKFEETNRDLAESFDKGESQLMGTADLLDGLATTMGLNIDGAIQMSRGFADMASGIKTTVIPQVEAMAAKLKALSATMTATPGRRWALGMGVAATATLAFASQTEKGGDILDRVYDQALKNANKTLGVVGDSIGWVDSKLGGLGGKLLSATGWFKGTEQAAKDSADRLLGWAAAAEAAARAIALANRFGGTVDDPDGAFASQSWIDSNSGQAALVADMEQRASAVGSAASKAVKSVADKTKDAFEKVKPKLEAAAEKFADAISMRDAFRDKFKLGFGDDIGHDVTESLRRQVDRFQQFTKKIASLRKMGLNESLVRDFADAGPGALDEMNRINSGNLSEIKRLAKAAGRARDQFSDSETMRRTGVDTNKPVKVTLDIKGGDTDLKNMIKKWVRTDGGGNVQVAFR